jgi:hypothetical protein
MKSEEDEAFDDLARRQGMWGGGFHAKQRMAADKFIAVEERKVGERYGYVPKLHPSEWMDESAQEPVARVLQIIKELRPAIKPMEGMGKGKTTAEWFDILVKEIERIQPAQEPVAWVGLTDEERESIAQDYSLTGFGYQSPFKAIEDKLKEKNT